MTRLQLGLCILLFLPLAIGFEYLAGTVILADREDYCEEQASRLELSDEPRTQTPGPNELFADRVERLMDLLRANMSPEARSFFEPDPLLHGPVPVDTMSRRDTYIGLCEYHEM